MDANAMFDRANELMIEQDARFKESGKTETQFYKDENEAEILRRIRELRDTGDRKLNQNG